MKKYFYDIHCHAMNMSHPNFLAFIKRFEDMVFKDTDKFLKSNRLILLLAANFLLIKFLFFKKFDYKNLVKILKKTGVDKYPDRAKNLLAAMENDTGSFFLLMEECLMDNLVKNRKLIIDNKEYDKIIITPLIMDFGTKTVYYDEIHYNNRPINKPVVKQIIDIFNGIKNYKKLSRYNMLEIYPFMGINTTNYSLNEIRIMLNTYFDNYKGSHQAFKKKMGNFSGSMQNIADNRYAGIKLYPPLGFDPWPENKRELEKVQLLYDICQKKGIPITCHCSDEGFSIKNNKEMEKLTSPLKWEKVLKNYNRLTLNLAHLGKQDHSDDWQKIILKLIIKHANVYSDISYRGFDNKFYEYLKKTIYSYKDSSIREKIKKRILFGSDFMINLLKTESYCDYFDVFSKTKHFTPDEKDYFCSINPQRFLFKNELAKFKPKTPSKSKLYHKKI
ncbi:amidohydrolase family protein [Herbivorax sp. ANBcel31]|uniref:amidohydrolase family protein n=1 Tax=Herbivorax sp. ANBcel31 TaxID=3069754 RepID=UPI0027B5DB89|nr:amidohydrolase family protein [Herbivorax sp. ANBcel31]MDQ2086866.1 amidohydrolase family protein [Herbivorax sp. ANBcel31]